MEYKLPKNHTVNHTFSVDGVPYYIITRNLSGKFTLFEIKHYKNSCKVEKLKESLSPVKITEFAEQKIKKKLK